MQLENDKNNDNGNDFVFDINEAMKVVWANISDKLKQKFSFEEIFAVLEIEQHFYDELGINISEDDPLPIHDFPIEIDWEDLQYKIINQAATRNIYLTYEELDMILDAETLYYQINGQLGKMDEFLN